MGAECVPRPCIMKTNRRVLLQGLGATFLGGTALSSLSAAEVAQVQTQHSATNGVHAAAHFTDESRILGLSDDVRVTSAANPAPGGEGGSAAERVLHITSLPRGEQRPGEGQGGGRDRGTRNDDSNDDGVTYDYGLSLLGVSGRELTVSDLAEREDDAGFAYDWLVTDENVAGVGTAEEEAGVGPDEAWLVLREGQQSTSGSGTGIVEDALSGRLTAVIRERQDDRGTDEWHTRDVAAELGDDSEPRWQELTIQSGQFVDVDAAPAEDYGDAHVVAVGVGRGDPYEGPSVLDAYYRELRVGGEAYVFPKARGGSRRGRGPD